MTTAIPSLRATILFSCLGAALAAQTPPNDEPRQPCCPASRLAIDQVVFDDSPDGTIWGGGRTYKAAFRAGVATYVPFFGSTAPHDFPVAFRVRDLRSGGTPVPVANGATPHRTDARITLDHGVFTETWDLDVEQCEQSFVFRTPVGTGDLVLTIDVDTELTAAAADGGVRFANELGAVVYGQAIVIDADGRRTPVATRPAGASIEIDVPAAVLARARFPVVVDPLVTTWTVSTATANEHNLDAAYDVVHGQWLLAWESDFSATDHDVLSQLATFDGTPIVGTQVAIDFTSDSWVDPRVASHRQGGTGLVVAQRLLPAPSQIWGRVRALGTSIVGATFQISQNGGSHPDVGGDNSVAGTSNFFVVWHVGGIANATIVGRQVTTGGLTFGAEIPLGTGMTNVSFPAIANCAGEDSPIGLAWPIVWPLNAQSTAAPYRIRGVVVANFGLPLGAEADWFTHPTQAMSAPSVSSLTDAIGGQRYFAVAWQQDVGGGNRDIFVGVRSQNAAIVPGTDLTPIIGGSGTADDIAPSIDSFGSRFSLAFARSSLFFPYDIVAATIDLPASGPGLTIGAVETTTYLSASTSSSPANGNVRICSAHSGGGDEPALPPRYLAGWERAGDVFDAAYEAHAPAGGYTTLATSCGAFGITASGHPHTGGYINGSLLYAGSAPTVVAIALPLPAPVALCGSCQVAIDPNAIFVLLGGPTFSWAVPPVGGYTGFALMVQGIAIGSPTCFGDLAFSDSVRAVLQ